MTVEQAFQFFVDNEKALTILIFVGGGLLTILLSATKLADWCIKKFWGFLSLCKKSSSQKESTIAKPAEPIAPAPVKKENPMSKPDYNEFKGCEHDFETDVRNAIGDELESFQLAELEQAFNAAAFKWQNVITSGHTFGLAIQKTISHAISHKRLGAYLTKLHKLRPAFPSPQLQQTLTQAHIEVALGQ